MTVSPLDRLLAESDIRTLKARYFRHLDAHEWGELAELFTSDAVILVPAWDTPRGPSEAIPFYRDYMEPTESVHHGFMPEISVVAGSQARALWRMEDRIYRLVEGSQQDYSLAHGFGYYHDEYRRVDGHWRISASTLTRSRQDIVPIVRKKLAE